MTNTPQTTKTPDQLGEGMEMWDGDAWVPVLGPAQIRGDIAVIPVLLYGAMPIEIERPATQALAVRVQA